VFGTFLLLFVSFLCASCTANATEIDALTANGGTPYFFASATVLENRVIIDVTRCKNLDHAAILDANSNWIGNMIWNSDGTSLTYTINGVPAGTYKYQVKGASVPAIEGKMCLDTDANASFVSATIAPKAIITTSSYGTSGNGVDLKVVKIEPLIQSTSKVLVTFEIHGFEDSYNRDGQVLVDIGNSLINYFYLNPEKLGSTTLYVVASANPDGLSDGWTNNGPGRCQTSKGVDINRDLNYYWTKRTNDRNKTLSPFSAPESRALRDLVIYVQPNDVVDIHGWLSTTYGTSSLCKYFQNAIGIGRSSELSGVSGYFSAWATKYATRTALIELPDTKTSDTSVINAFVELFKN